MEVSNEVKKIEEINETSNFFISKFEHIEEGDGLVSKSPVQNERIVNAVNIGIETVYVIEDKVIKHEQDYIEEDETKIVDQTNESLEEINKDFIFCEQKAKVSPENESDIVRRPKSYLVQILKTDDKECINEGDFNNFCNVDSSFVGGEGFSNKAQLVHDDNFSELDPSIVYGKLKPLHNDSHIENENLDVYKPSKPFRCNECEKYFSTKRNLTIHIQVVHEKFKPYKCSDCEKTFGKKGTLSSHIGAVHNKLKLWECTFCEKAFTRRAVLIRHVLEVHEKYKPCKCNECDFSTTQKGALENHIRRVHKKPKRALDNPATTIEGNLKPFKCNYCENISFCKKRYLFTHIRAVHEKLKSFKCTSPNCEKAFSQRGTLNQHIRAVHNKVRLFKCTYCDKDFSQRGAVTQHVRAIHENLKPFKCVECDYATSRKDILENHIRAIHEKFKL